jgi:hypothetical protein
MPIYVTPEGFIKRRQPEIKTDLQNAFRTIYGNDVQLSEASVNGQFIGTLSENLADTWDMIEAAYDSFFVNAVTGRTQEFLYALNNIRRKQASASTVALTIYGTVGFNVPAGFQAATDSGLTFSTTEDAVIGGGGDIDVPAECTVTGPNEAPADTIINIKTPLGLVTGVNNAADALPGVSQETDALFRLRRSLSTGASGKNLLESAFGQLSDLQGVQSVRVYQNREDVTLIDYITQTANFTIGAVLTGVDSGATGIILKDTDTGDSGTLTLGDVKGVFQVDEIITDSGAGSAEAAEVGLPPHSWMPVVEGGDDDEIAQIVWQNTPSGIGSVGDTEVIVPSIISPDVENLVRFQRPELVEISVNLTVRTNLLFPADGAAQIRQNIVDYAAGLLLTETGFAGFGIGKDVTQSRVCTPINLVQGHTIDSLEIWKDSEPPELVVPIEYNNRSAWSIDRINVTVLG